MGNVILYGIAKAKESTTLKVFLIGFLILLLLIPARMVWSLIKERESRQADVVSEISSKWGRDQTISGPIISLPYKQTIEGQGQKKSVTVGYLHVLPDEIKISGDVAPQMRYRGIYEAVLYTAQLKLSGEFTHPDFKAHDIPEKNILWDQAFIAVGITDMKGVRESIYIRLNDMKLAMNPGIHSRDVLSSGVSAGIPWARKAKKISYELELSLNGSLGLAFVPVGKQTSVELNSSWKSPSFDGSFLPKERTINQNGFNATWNVLHLNRNYPQSWKGNGYSIDNSSFGVGLFIPADAYQKVTRMAKYAVMFIAFTFMSFFMSEVMNKLRIHPFQYLLIGLALIIFYALLLSISEHLSFSSGYLISSAATIALVTSYARSILRKRSLAATVGCILAILYAYLYILLQVENYTLLLGSIGLFVVLSVVMYLTRKINWYTTGGSTRG